MASATAVDFVLDAFNSDVTMTTKADISGVAPVPMTVDCWASLDVSVTDMQSVFKFESDSLDITDVLSTDIKYFVDQAAWTAMSEDILNPANARVDYESLPNSATPDGNGHVTNYIAITDNVQKNMVAHDFVRYLAKKLFNTHLGVDLFANEVALLANLRTICGMGVDGDVKYSMQVISDALDAAGTSEIPRIASTEASENATNIVRTLLQQLISSNSARLADLEAYRADSESNIFKFPFAIGDSIAFKVTIEPAANQYDIVGLASDAIPARTYGILLKMKAAADVANSEVLLEEIPAEV